MDAVLIPKVMLAADLSHGITVEENGDARGAFGRGTAHGPFEGTLARGHRPRWKRRNKAKYHECEYPLAGHGPFLQGAVQGMDPKPPRTPRGVPGRCSKKSDRWGVLVDFAPVESPNEPENAVGIGPTETQGFEIRVLRNEECGGHALQRDTSRRHFLEGLSVKK